MNTINWNHFINVIHAGLFPGCIVAFIFTMMLPLSPFSIPVALASFAISSSTSVIFSFCFGLFREQQPQTKLGPVVSEEEWKALPTGHLEEEFSRIENS